MHRIYSKTPPASHPHATRNANKSQIQHQTGKEHRTSDSSLHLLPRRTPCPISTSIHNHHHLIPSAIAGTAPIQIEVPIHIQAPLLLSSSRSMLRLTAIPRPSLRSSSAPPQGSAWMNVSTPIRSPVPMPIPTPAPASPTAGLRSTGSIGRASPALVPVSLRLLSPAAAAAAAAAPGWRW